MEEAAPLESGEYEFVFDDVLEVRLLDQGGGALVAYGLLGKLPEDDEERRAKLLLALKGELGPWGAPARKVLSLDENDHRFFVYQKVDDSRLDASDFVGVMDAFVNDLESWSGYLGQSVRSSRVPPAFVFP